MIAPLIPDAGDGADSDLHDMCSQLDDVGSLNQLQEVIAVAAAQEQKEQVLKAFKAKLVRWSQAQQRHSTGICRRMSALAERERMLQDLPLQVHRVHGVQLPG